MLALALLAVRPADAAPFTAADVANGRYLATAADCAACHTAPDGGKAFAGGLAVASPLGPIYASNITPSVSAGIGAYSEAQFARALRQGVAGDGTHLYPAMPYTAYTGLGDPDIHALYAYFMQGVTAVDTHPPQTHLAFPFDQRAAMIGWNALFLHDARFARVAAQTPAWNRGAYLVETLGHCGTCHTPRNLLMGARTGDALSGGPLGAWYAPNITSDPISGIGGWSQAELTAYLATGDAAGKGQAAGPMGEAVAHSLQHLRTEDLQAIAIYLKTVPPIRDVGETKAAFAYGQASHTENLIRGAGAPDRTSGEALFSGACASCHQPTGAGSRTGVFPALFHNTATGAGRPNSLIAAILQGVDRDAAGHHAFMPAFGEGAPANRLSDAQIVQVGTYVLQTYGDPAVHFTAADVAISRRGGAASPLPRFVMIGATVAATLLVLVLGLIIGFGLRRRAKARSMG